MVSGAALIHTVKSEVYLELVFHRDGSTGVEREADFRLVVKLDRNLPLVDYAAINIGPMDGEYALAGRAADAVDGWNHGVPLNRGWKNQLASPTDRARTKKEASESQRNHGAPENGSTLQNQTLPDPVRDE